MMLVHGAELALSIEEQWTHSPMHGQYGSASMLPTAGSPHSRSHSPEMQRLASSADNFACLCTDSAAGVPRTGGGNVVPYIIMLLCEAGAALMMPWVEVLLQQRKGPPPWGVHCSVMGIH